MLLRKQLSYPARNIVVFFFAIIHFASDKFALPISHFLPK